MRVLKEETSMVGVWREWRGKYEGRWSERYDAGLPMVRLCGPLYGL